MVSQQLIKELKTILLEDYGKEVTQAEASEIAHTLVGYFNLLGRIFHRIKNQNNDDDKITTK